MATPRNKTYYVFECFGVGGRRHWKHCHIGLPTYSKTNLPYPDRLA